MKGKYLKGKTIEYDGSQLSPLWAYENLDLLGDSIVAFRGPCSVSDEHIVDVENAKKNSIISSQDMLHFLVEDFGCGINEIVLVQRLLVTVVIEALRDSEMHEEVDLEREYDNIFAYLQDEEERRKLTVSVATVSPVSGVIHLGLNVIGEGAPARATGLTELGVEDIDKFAVDVLRRFIEEMQNVRMDSSKVRPVY
ncbi:MAG: DUF366 family protein [Actinobacteria bacterium]|nr:DUF366 family protein [Actinomycetota bacterium]